MNRKEKERERKLTSLILTGLMLSNGMFFMPMAEAGETFNVTADSAGGMDVQDMGSFLYLKPTGGTSAQGGNTINFNGGTSWANAILMGGEGANGASGNRINITGGSLMKVWGGNNSFSTAGNNYITITGGSLANTQIYGTSENVNTSTNNTIEIKGNFSGDIQKIHVGYYGTNSGNTLKLGTTGINVTNGVHYADKIEITRDLSLANGGTVISSKYFTGSDGSSILPVLDVTDLYNVTTPGTVTLIQGTGSQSLANMQVVWKNHAATTITSAQVVKNVNDDDKKNNVQLNYNIKHTLDRPTDKTFTYQIENNVTSVSFDGDIAWNKDTPVRTLTDAEKAKYTINSSTTTDVSGLSITGTATSQSMTLLSGASGIKNSTTAKNIALAANFNDANGVNWVGTATSGNVVSSSTEGTVKYNITGGTASSINLNGWSSGNLSFLSGWSGTGIAVNTGSFTATPASGTILTAPTGSSFGEVTGAKKYASGEAFSGDTEKGVTLSGTKAGGVRVNATDATKLEYVAEERNTTGVSLGDVTWNDGRAATSAYDFTGVTGVDASNLNVAFSGTDANTVTKNTTKALLSDATNLKANLPVTGTSHSQDISYTDAKGVKLSGTLTGDVTTAAGEVDYTVSAKTLNKVDLTGWDGTNAGTVDGSWEATSGSVAVDTGNFTVTPGSTNILTLANGTFGTITGDKVYTASGSFSGDTVKGVTLAGTKEGGVRANTTNAAILEYVAETKKPTSITLGNNMTWKDGRAADASYDFTNVTSINASDLKFTSYASGASADTIKATDTMALLSGANNLGAGTAVTGASNSQDISYTNAQGIKLSGTLTGNVSISNTAGVGQVDYTVGGKTLEKLDLSSWNGTTMTTLDTSWQTPTQIAVDTGTFTPPTSVAPGASVDIFTAPTGTTFGTVTGTRTYKNNEPFKDPAKSGVTLEGTTSGGVQKNNDSTKLTYTGLQNTVSKITLGKITSPTATFGSEYSFTGASVDDSGLSFENPENIGNGDNVTLFTSADNSQTPSVSPTDKKVYYSTTPVTGVTLNGQITGSYSNTDNKMTYSATGNNAQKLTFGNVEWKDTGALIDHSTTLTKVNFDGANVDTSNINFTNIKELEANKQMTLVSNYGGTPGSITGSKYKVGSTLQGEGKASMDGNSLIFTADTTAEKMEVQEQTHNTLMGASATMTSLAQGNEFINTTMDDMFLDANVGRDGIASFAHIGGGSLRQETGSHVNTHTWNAIVAFGHQNKKPRNTFEYGAFAEYGTGNFTTYNGDLRGDGSSRYVGGGVLAKWTAPSGLYVEGSVRAGSVHEDGSNLLQDINGVPYSYSTDTPYYGFHLGVGKKIPMKGGSVLDVYARYFYNHRNSTSFDAGGHYDLDAITSQVIRVGARYTVKRDKWNYYGGLAYEHELDGKAGGWADGMPIRGIDTGGGSFRAELGATIKPNDDIPLTLDLTLTGFAGKKQGIFGGMGLKFNF